MNVLRRLGLRSRLAITLAAMALLAVALATAISTSGLEGRLSDFSRDRLQAFADHTAQAAATNYKQDGRFSPQAVAELRHLAELNGFAAAVEDRAGDPIEGSGILRGSDRAGASVRVAGREVARVVVAPRTDKVLGAEEQSLRDRLGRLHLLAALLAGAIAVMAAFLAAPQLTEPIRRLTRAARRMEQGELTKHIDEKGGGREFETLTHAFNRLSETLRREEEIRRESAADVAHELRSPVTGLIGRIEAAQDDLVADQQANLEAMHTEALRLARLVEDLGRLADAQRPGLLVKKTSLDLADVVHRAAAKYADLFGTNGLDFQERLERARVMGDASRIEQIVDNLLSNALRYTNDGGRVTLRVSQQAHEAVIEVEDTGIGISPDDLRHIFKRFWRGEKSRSRATGGAGIGLAIVQELVRAHGGRIDVDSAPGRGSRFRVALPSA